MNENGVIAKASEAHVSALPKSLVEDSRKKLGELLDLSDAQKDRMKKWLKENIQAWDSDMTDLRRRLQDDNDLVEGVIMETDFPWVGASNVHVPITEIYMSGYRSIIRRSALGAGTLWVAEAEVDDLMGAAADIEEMLDYKARNVWNIYRAVDGVIWTTQRDGLGILQVPYVEEFEKAHDVILLTSEDDFIAEFPDPESASLSEEEWYAMAEMVKTQASEDFPIEVPIEFDKPIYIGPRAEIVDRVDFVTFPASVSDIKSSACRGYGKVDRLHIEEIRQKVDDKVFYSDAADKVIKGSKATQINSYTQSRDEISGIRRGSASSKDQRETYELVIKGRLDADSEIEKFLVTYSMDSDELLGCCYYFYRVDFYALFRIDERPNQLDGKNIPSKVRDLNDVIDTSVNLEINIRTISNVPIFKGHKDFKEELDPELQQNKIRPGMIIWLSDFDSFDQFKIQPTDLGENANMQERMMRVLDMYMGMPASLFAGGVPSGDPSAPGNKTAALINQGNLRMEDPISYFRYGIEDLGNICLSHEYQFGTPLIQYKNAEGETKTIHKKFLRKNIRLKMNGISVLDNPDAEMQKAFQLLQTLEATVPSFTQDPELPNVVARDALKKGRVSGRDRYLPTQEQMQQKAVDIQKQAIIQMAQEKQAADAKAQQDMVTGNLANAKQHLDIQETARKLAQEKLGMNETPVEAPGGAQ